MRALCVPAVVVPTLVRAAVPLLSSVAIAGLMCAPVYAQWVKVPAGGIPKGPDGKPNLSAPAPRSAEGHPACPECGNPAAPSTFWTLRRISNPVTCHFSLGPRRLWTNAQTARIRARIPPQTACPEVSRGSMPPPHHGG